MSRTEPSRREIREALALKRKLEDSGRKGGQVKSDRKKQAAREREARKRKEKSNNAV